MTHFFTLRLRGSIDSTWRVTTSMSVGHQRPARLAGRAGRPGWEGRAIRSGLAGPAVPATAHHYQVSAR